MPFQGLSVGQIYSRIVHDCARPPLDAFCAAKERAAEERPALEVYTDLLQRCWAAEPSLRPRFTEVRTPPNQDAAVEQGLYPAGVGISADRLAWIAYDIAQSTAKTAQERKDPCSVHGCHWLADVVTDSCTGHRCWGSFQQLGACSRCKHRTAWTPPAAPGAPAWARRAEARTCNALCADMCRQLGDNAHALGRQTHMICAAAGHWGTWLCASSQSLLVMCLVDGFHKYLSAVCQLSWLLLASRAEIL